MNDMKPRKVVAPVKPPTVNQLPKSPVTPVVTAPVTRSWFDRFRLPIIATTLLACMAGVGAISYYVLIHASLRLDESQSLWQTSHSIGDTLRVVAEDVHVPMYHVILHFWQLYFGNGVITARLLSLVFFLITIPLVYRMARIVLSTRWSLFATVLFSFAPFMDWYANEARMYTLLVMMATLSQTYFLGIIQRRKGSWRGFGITAVIGAYSHYFFSFNLAAEGLYYIINHKRFAKGSFRRFIIVGLLVTAALAPWLVYFHALGSGKDTSPLLMRPSTVDFFNAFSQFIFGFQDDYVNTILVSCWPLTVLVAFLAIRRGQKITPEISYLATAAFVPVLLAYVLSFVVTPFYLSRYMISCVAPLIIIIVWLISHYGRRLATAAVVILVAITAVTSLQQDRSRATPVKEDYQAVASMIQTEARPQDVIVLSAPFTVYPFEYYYSGNSQIDTLPIWNRKAQGSIPAFNAKTMPGQIQQIADNHHYVYLVLSQNQGYEATIKQYYLHHYKEVSHHTYSNDLTLYVFQVGYTTVPAIGTPSTLIEASASPSPTVKAAP